MSCEGKEICPIHGDKYMKRLGGSTDGSEPYCAGCHAGEMAVRQEYEAGILRGARDAGVGWKVGGRNRDARTTGQELALVRSAKAQGLLEREGGQDSQHVPEGAKLAQAMGG